VRSTWEGNRYTVALRYDAGDAPTSEKIDANIELAKSSGITRFLPQALISLK
jgi:hypothetical protein